MIILDDFFKLEDNKFVIKNKNINFISTEFLNERDIKNILESASEIINSKSCSNSLLKNCKDKLIFNLFLSHLHELEQHLRLLPVICKPKL